MESGTGIKRCNFARALYSEFKESANHVSFLNEKQNTVFIKLKGRRYNKLDLQHQYKFIGSSDSYLLKVISRSACRTKPGVQDRDFSQNS